MWGGQLWFSSMMGEEQKSEETHSAFVERCQSTALKVLKWGPKGNFAHNRREENTEYVCIGSWEERIVLYVLYLVHTYMYSKEKKSATIYKLPKGL